MDVNRWQLGLSTTSERQGAELVDPFFSLCGIPDQQHIVGCSRCREMPRDDQHARTGVRANELEKMSRHGFPVVGDKEAPLACRERQNFRIVQTSESRLYGGLKIYGGFPPPHSLGPVKK